MEDPIAVDNVGMFHLCVYGEVESTNTLVKRAISEGAPEGLAVSAEVQTAGYGRRGNPWKSSRGGVYLSVLLRPQMNSSELQTASLMVAVAVRRALAGFLPQDAAETVKIKWPNDIVVAEKGGQPPEEGSKRKFQKLCGISVEQKSGAVCVGIGVNVQRPSGDGSLDSNRNAIAYFDELFEGSPAPSVDDVRKSILDSLSSVYREWLEGSFAALQTEFQENFALDGFHVHIDRGDAASPARGKVIGINSEGHLLVRPDDGGDAEEVVSGTVTITSWNKRQQ